MTARTATVLIPWLCLILTCACSKTEKPADAGVTDGDAGADLDPCEALQLEWSAIWEVVIEDSTLGGNTPDNDLMDVWGSAPNDIFAVGFRGNIIHYDGSSWSKVESGTQEDLKGVWGFVLRDEEGAEIRKDVYAVGSSGTILHRHTDTQTSGTPSWHLELVFRLNPDTQDKKTVTDSFQDVWGLAAPGANPDQYPVVIAVGSAGLIAQYVGEVDEFQEMLVRVEITHERDGGNTTEIVHRRWTPESLGGVFLASRSLYITVGTLGTILEFDGTSWNRNVITGFVTHLKGVWGQGENEIFAVGLDGTILRRYQGAWENLRQVIAAFEGTMQVQPVYLRNAFTVFQDRCGEVPDGGTEATNTSWGFFVGWDSRVYLLHDRAICPFGDLPIDRIEGIWGQQSRGLEERTAPDGGVTCDPIEVLLTGVKGTIVRLIDEEGR